MLYLLKLPKLLLFLILVSLSCTFFFKILCVLELPRAGYTHTNMNSFCTEQHPKWEHQLHEFTKHLWYCILARHLKKQKNKKKQQKHKKKQQQHKKMINIIQYRKSRTPKLLWNKLHVYLFTWQQTEKTHN